MQSGGTGDTSPDATAGGKGRRDKVRPWRGLSAKFLVLTILFVMLVEVLVLIPSVANYRWTWLTSRLDQVRAAQGIFLSAVGDEMLEMGLLKAVNADSIVLRQGEMAQIIKTAGPLKAVDETVWEDRFSVIGSITGAFDQLRNGGNRMIRIVSEPSELMNGRLEVVVNDSELQAGMLRYMRNIILISLLIAILTAILIYGTVRALLIRPIQRMTEAMLSFAAAPQSTALALKPSMRSDEVGLAERELADMQHQLSETLAQQRRLAELGLAVAKINHDMRNILASAQLVSDRLVDVDDPLVQRVAPRLIRAIDRAIGYSEGVMEYGRAGEAKPKLEPFELAGIVEETRGLLLGENDRGVDFVCAVPDGFTVCADREHLLRVLLNLCRNAVQAMVESDSPRKCLTIAADETGRFNSITVSDTGPGLPDAVTRTLFAPFSHSTTKGGTGLGLSIARELVEAHGGAIAADSQLGQGTTFTIRLPTEGT